MIPRCGYRRETIVLVTLPRERPKVRGPPARPSCTRESSGFCRLAGLGWIPLGSRGVRGYTNKGRRYHPDLRSSQYNRVVGTRHRACVVSTDLPRVVRRPTNCRSAISDCVGSFRLSTTRYSTPIAHDLAIKRLWTVHLVGNPARCVLDCAAIHVHLLKN